MKNPAHITLICLLLWGLCTSTLHARKTDPDAILGIWTTTNGKGRVAISFDEKTHSYFGKIVWLRTPKDESGNPVRDQNGNKVMGMKVLWGFNFDDGRWVNGNIYDPESGKTYYATLELDGNNKLKMRGSIDSFGLIGRTETWNRFTAGE